MTFRTRIDKRRHRTHNIPSSSLTPTNPEAPEKAFLTGPFALLGVGRHLLLNRESEAERVCSLGGAIAARGEWIFRQILTLAKRLHHPSFREKYQRALPPITPPRIRTNKKPHRPTRIIRFSNLVKRNKLHHETTKKPQTPQTVASSFLRPLNYSRSFNQGRYIRNSEKIYASYSGYIRKFGGVA